MSRQNPTDTPATHAMTLGVQFGTQAAGAIAPAMSNKGLLHRYFSDWFGFSQLLPPLLSIVGAGSHLQYVAELPYGQLVLPLGDMLVHTHRIGWLKMAKTFLKYLPPARLV